MLKCSKYVKINKQTNLYLYWTKGEYILGETFLSEQFNRFSASERLDFSFYNAAISVKTKIKPERGK